MCTPLISDTTYPYALGRLGVALPSVPYICFASGLGFSAIKHVERNPLVGSSCMNFDIWAVPGGCSVHGLHACISCLHSGMLHCISHVGILCMHVGMLYVHISCWHFVHTVSMLCLHNDILCMHDGILQELHNEYVLVPADKASNNIIIVCKKYYSEVIRNELAGKSGKASTYVHCRDSVDQIVQKHLAYMHSTKIKVAEDMKRLPMDIAL